MNHRQLKKRNANKGLSLFAQKKISREEYAALQRGRAWFRGNNLYQSGWCSIRHYWDDTKRAIEQHY